MRDKIVGGIMVAIGAFFIVVAIMAIVGRPATEKKLKEAPFVTDGKIDSANEGKTVIVFVKNLNDFEGTYDEEFGFHFPYLGVVRFGEKLKEVADGKFKWEREYQQNLFGKLKGTEYEISGDLLVSVGRLVDVHKSDLDAKEMQCYAENQIVEWGSLSNGSRVYISDIDPVYFEDYGEDGNTLKAYIRKYRNQVGGSRVYYKYRDFSDCKNVAIIGKQKGNKLVRDDSVDTVPAFENISSKDDLIKKDRIYLIGGIVVFAGLGCGTLVFLGVRKIRNAV
ncbi:MAG: hypothetical protein E7277_01590 [Lachnospiraceae bacterium]|nr:hypothetical protein [Lachnospiraceae bacterium]